MRVPEGFGELHLERSHLATKNVPSAPKYTLHGRVNLRSVVAVEGAGVHLGDLVHFDRL
jgi:hypothetical protein